MSSNLRIGFIGLGNVGQTLTRALANAGYNIAAIYSRDTEKTANATPHLPNAFIADNAQAVVDTCDLVFLTVSDDAIQTVCSYLTFQARHSVIHCSGATELAALDAAKKQGAAVGGFHPLQTFTNPSVALQGLAGCTVGIEADGELFILLETMAAKLSLAPLRLKPSMRGLYHASAYYVGPFLLALLNEAAQIWQGFGATEKETLAALMPLLQSTIRSVNDSGIAGGMAGCISRGDGGTVKKHLNELEKFSVPAVQLYCELALRNVPLGLTRGSLSEARAAEIKALLLEKLT